MANKRADSIPSQQQVWDTLYRKKNRIWGNAPIEFGKIASFGTILELGIGDGKNLKGKEFGEEMIIGVDISREAIIRSMHDPLLKRVILLVSDAQTLPFHSESFDQIHVHHILGHLLVTGRECMLNEIFRVLKPGGEIYLTVFARGDFRESKGDLVEENTYLRGDGVIMHYFTQDEISSIFHPYRIIKIQVHQWQMKIRGIPYERKLITGIFRKRRTMNMKCHFYL